MERVIREDDVEKRVDQLWEKTINGAIPPGPTNMGHVTNGKDLEKRVDQLWEKVFNAQK